MIALNYVQSSLTSIRFTLITKSDLKHKSQGFNKHLNVILLKNFPFKNKHLRKTLIFLYFPFY